MPGIEQRAEVADGFAKGEDLLGNALLRAMDDEPLADQVERDRVVRHVGADFEEVDAAGLGHLGEELAAVRAIRAVRGARVGAGRPARAQPSA
jgi:hypothetical protein